MAVQSGTTSAPPDVSQSSEISRVAVEGISAGLIGAATIALWFFVLDLFNDRPFYTPNILGNALFGRGVDIEQMHTLPISVEMVVMYTWVHALAFCVIGGVASRLLAWAERDVNLGFGILLFLVIFEFGFVGLAFLFAEPILHALTWPAVLMGNLLAAAAMGLYFWRHHLNLSIEP
jgi:hypothetical protein